MANNIIDSIQLSGVTYGIKGSGGTETIELTQAQYDALVDKDPNVFYIITDATAGDLSNYYTKSETSGATEIQSALDAKADTATTYTKTEVDNAITAATSTKQDTLVSGTNIKTINNQSILGSGNINIQGGGGGVTTGEVQTMIDESISGKQDTILGLWSESPYRSVSIGYSNDNSVNCNSSLAVGSSNTFGTGTRASIAVGDYNTVGGDLTTYGMYVFGGYCKATNSYSLANGYHVNTDNMYEAGFGTYNKTTYDYTKPFGDSGNTLFSVGNGTSSARHNAFEIRQNGDIYLSSGGTDIKLQDHLGGGGSSITIDPTLDSGSTNAVANSAITEAFNGVTYGSPSTFSSSFVGSRTAYAIIYDVPTQNIVNWYFRCFDSSVHSYTSVGIKDNNYFYDSSTGQIFTDIPDWIDQELSYYDSTTRKRYVFLKNGVYADYFSNVNKDTFTIFETNNTGLIGSLLSKHSIDTVAHTTSAEKTAWNAKLDSSAITTSLSSSSTDSQVPSAKAVYDAIGDIETLLSQI